MKKGTRFFLLLLVVSLLVPMMGGIALSEEQELRTVTVMSKMFDDSTGLDASKRAEYPAYQEFVRQTNERGLDVQFDLIANEQYEVVLQTRFAAGTELPDIINAYSYVTDANAIAYGKKGLVLDLYELYETYDEDGSIMERIDTYFPELLGFVTTDDGKMYWTSYAFSSEFVEGTPIFGSSYALNLRKDWVEAIGKEWKLELTTDELFDILMAFSDQDVNGNGIRDETINIPVTGFENGIAQAFGLPTNLAQFVSDREEVQCPWYCEGIEDYLRYMKKIVDNGLYNTALLGTNTWEGLGPQLLAENKVSAEHSYFGQTWLEADIVGVDDAAFGPVLLDDGDGRFLLIREGVLMGYWNKTFISAGTKDKQAVVDLLDYLWTSNEFDILNKGGIEGQTFDFVKGLKTNLVKAEGTEGVDFVWREDKDVFIEEYHKLPDILQDPSLKDIPLYEFLYIVPKMDMTWIHLEDKLNPTDYPYKNAGNHWVNENQDKIVSNHTTQLLAMLTDEEAETLNQYENILNTYSSELLIDMILGNRNIDDLSMYVEEMRQLGLDEYLAIFTARNERFKAALE